MTGEFWKTFSLDQRVRTWLSNSILWVALAALVSQAVYLVLLVEPYGLREWWSYPLLSIGKISNYAPTAAATYLVALATLFALYSLVLQNVRGRQPATMWGIVLLGAAAFSIVMLWQYPVDAADIFDYIIRGRLQALYGANPFYDIPNQFPQDPFLSYSAWGHVPTAYGPWWEAIASVAARLAGNDVITNVLVFKSINVLAYAATAGLIALYLKRHAPDRALLGVVLFAWNPLVIFSVAGSGHNDALMALFVILGFYLLLEQHFTLAALAVTAGALVKFIPALILPVIVLAGVFHERDWVARLRYLVVTGTACALLVGISYLPYWNGGDILGISRRIEMYTTSLPTLLLVVLRNYIDPKLADTVVSRLALAWLGAWIIQQMYLLFQRARTQAPGRHGFAPLGADAYVQGALSILLFYLLVSCLWFQAWYVIWPLALAALLPEGFHSALTLLLSVVSVWKMPLFDFILFGGRPLPEQAIREWPLTLGVMGIPWLFVLAYQFSSWMGKRQKSPTA